MKFIERITIPENIVISIKSEIINSEKGMFRKQMLEKLPYPGFQNKLKKLETKLKSQPCISTHDRKLLLKLAMQNELLFIVMFEYN